MPSPSAPQVRKPSPASVLTTPPTFLPKVAWTSVSSGKRSLRGKSPGVVCRTSGCTCPVLIGPGGCYNLPVSMAQARILGLHLGSQSPPTRDFRPGTVAHPTRLGWTPACSGLRELSGGEGSSLWVRGLFSVSLQVYKSQGESDEMERMYVTQTVRVLCV